MAKTAVLPASAMRSPRHTEGDITGLNWTQLPGSASQVASSGDGTVWVLSTEPAGSTDKYIWHYAGGTWTNISGLASHIAVAPDGTLYASNSAGGTYKYANGSWSALGGGASDVTVAADASVYVLSNAGGAGDETIWHNVAGTWTQLPGTGSQIVASWDTGAYSISSGSVGATGLYILNTAGGIYYENANSTFTKFPDAAAGIAPTTNGGVFVLAYPVKTGGEPIYYFDLSNPGWTPQPGWGVSIASDGTHLYVVAASGAIYQAPLTSSVPTASTSYLSFAAANSAAQTFTLAEPGYTGTLSESDTCKPASGTIASVTPLSPNGPSATITVTPAALGTCTITFANSFGKNVQVGVTVGSSTVIISRK